MKNLFLIVSLIMFFVVKPSITNAQAEPDSSALYIIETMDGNEFTGLLISQDDEKVVLKTRTLGDLVINKSSIRKMTHISPNRIKEGKVWVENTQSSRYFWSPNGYGLQKGEGYYQNIWVLWNQASVGITDNISMGVGLIPLFLFGTDAAEVSPVWIVPKFSIPVTKDIFNLGFGALIGSAGFQNDAGFGIAYGLGTLGNRDNNLTLGAGYGYAGGTWSKQPMITLSGMFRTGAKGFFVTENYYISSGSFHVVLLSLGGRSLIKKVGLDYGLIVPFSDDMDAFIALPWLGFTVPFGQKKH